ncbi:Exo_endo_phos domain-containing protein [Cephalotus follicularis]|uniref:Exo_endo_phos domain-containing protein n=1 Tax=Cephalotus follicularis TaxID=3775 RepID=A0A1Q3CLR3_CEPFO|nr:Exo_endo_phos domain-containing protein [Cephalotus follicularis]
MTDQAIHGKAVLGNGFVVRLSFVYGLCDYRSRRDLWKDLIFHTQLASSVPWLILGDFNVSRFPHEQLNGPPRVSKAMSEFNECLKSMEVDDIKSVGRFFTWSNKRVGNFVVNKKLDRVLGNWEWHNHFNHSLAHFHNPGVSDHSLVSVSLSDFRSNGNKPFKFLNFWVKDDRFLDIVRRVWDQRAIDNPLETVLCKLRNLKRELKSVFKKSNPSSKNEAIRVEIKTTQANLLLNPTNVGLLLKEKLLLSKLWKFNEEEESFLKQKSRIMWLRLGDSNNKFFHRSISALHHINHIGRLQKSDGSWACSPAEIEQVAVEHFSGFLGEQGAPGSDSFRRVYSKMLSEDQKALLGRGISDEEIRDAFWALNPEKAPGPDGFNGFFYRAV